MRPSITHGPSRNIEVIHTSLAQVLAYPCQDDPIIQLRLQEAKSLGIQTLLNGGNEKIRGVSVLGKGYCGVVLLAHWHKSDRGYQTVALKARRTDAPKANFDDEAKGLAIANSQGIGPKLHAHSQNFIVMDYLDGPTLYQWLQNQATQNVLDQVLRDLLWQCFRLDQVELDHGNLRCITEHVIMQGNQPVMIDFSSSSCDRRPANVTTLTQGLFWGTKIPALIQAYRPLPAKEPIIAVLRQYKRHPTLETFQSLMNLLMH